MRNAAPAGGVLSRSPMPTASIRAACALALLATACSPPVPALPRKPAIPASSARASAALAPPPRPPPPAVPASPAPEPTQATIAWEVELARGTEHGVESIARVGDAIWAVGWYGDPRDGQGLSNSSLPVRKGNYDPFFARITLDGEVEAQEQLPGAIGQTIAASTDGEVLIGGEFLGELPGALVPKSPLVHAFVAKIGAASRRAIWTSGPNTMDIEHAWKIAPAPDGGAYLASELHAVVRRADEPSSKGDEDVLVSRYDAQGKRLWRTALGTKGSDWPFGLAALPGGDVITAGVVDARDADAHSASPRSYGFVTRLGADGSVKWERRFGGAGVNFVGGVAADARGHVFLVGVASGDVTLGGRAFHAEGLHDFLVAELDGEGEALWIRRLGSTRSPATDSRYHAECRFVLVSGGVEPQFLPRFGYGFVPTAISIAPDGTLAVGGGFVDEATIGDRAMGSANKHTDFVASLRGDGSVRWVSTACDAVRDVLAERDGVTVACARGVMKLAGR